ncbi:hypothetical protein NST84_29925 [Paenibacillus sp. FSL R7-0345]|uniref:hypothetical protein n=1 Tax=Paenibacillus sp. FSL R7-0345 TaxID=2954535 RepID=UPI003159D145
MLDFLAGALILGLGAFYYVILNKVFSITYIGFSGFFKVVGGCLVASLLTIGLTLDWIQSHPVWASIIGVVLLIIIIAVWVGKPSSENEVPESQDEVF